MTVAFRVAAVLGLAGALALGEAVAVSEVAAQATGSIRGRVTQSGGLRPLADVQVFVPGTGRGVLTDSDGNFLILNVPVGDRIVRAELIGHSPAEQAVTVTAGQAVTITLEMATAAIGLDEVVVTGTAGGAQRRAIGNVVGQVRGAETLDRAIIPNVQSMINGRSPNVVIQPGTGMIGSGSRIRIRGASSLSLSNEPLLYVDGVRVDNAQGVGPTVQAFGSGVISRLNDFNPEDIESIEIIKGPAAATLYGTEASNGVIQIITKKGRVGEPQFNFSMRQGIAEFANYEDRVPTNYWRNPGTGQIESLNLAKSENARGTPLWETGHLQNYSLSVSGGSEGARYYLAGDFDREKGVEPTNDLSRFSTRANVTVYPHEKIDIQGSLGYTSSRTYLACEAGCGGVPWGAFYSTPEFLNENLPATAPPRRGFRSFVAELYWESDDFQDLGRFTGSAQINHRPNNWLNHRLTIGTDEVREDNQSITERTPLLLVFSPGAVGGKSISRRDVSYNTLDYSASANLDVNASLTSTTTLGAQYYRRLTKFVSVSGSDFALPGLRAINATATRSGGETFEENVTVGVFAQQQFGWNNRLFVTGAIRADDNSAFGENFDLVYYPKASATWVVSEEDFWDVPFVSTLRLRTSYGQSGLQPSAFAALRTFGAVAGPGDGSVVTPQDAGNPDLGPERSKELEAGLDVAFLDDRLSLEFTYYTSRTTDAIVSREAPPSQGFPGFQFVNVGELKKNGIEVMLRGTPLQRENVALELTATLGRNESEIVDLGDNPRLVTDGTFGVEHREGGPVSGWYHAKLVDAELDAQGRFIRSSLMCETESGGSEPCYNAEGTLVADRVYLGRTLPLNEGSFSGTLTLFDRVRLYGMLDFKTGFKKWDHNLRVRCSLFNVCMENVAPLEADDPVEVAAFQNAGTFGATYIRDASFAKLREVSIGYDLPASFIQRFGFSRASITVAGRNLATWTKWDGIEPEAMYLSGTRGGNAQVEQNALPQLRQFATTINVSF
jgi:TonB-linked SusC/RagA family outer membrane protein